MFTFKSGAPVMDFTNSDLWNGGLVTRRQTSLLSTDVWEGGHLILHTEEPTCHLTQQPCPWHGGCNSPPPDFIPHLSPDLAPSFFLEECFFWSPSWLPLLKLQLITECEGWGCLYPPSLLDFPLQMKNYSRRGFETSPLPRVPGEGLSKAE